jgi:hypothetical protein
MAISLRIFDVKAQIVLKEFLIKTTVKSIGPIDNYVNNEQYNYISLGEGAAVPWLQNSLVRQPIGYKDATLKIADIFMIYPEEAEAQQAITVMLRNEPLVMYMGGFAIRAKLNLGADTALSGAMEASTKRFMILKEVQFFPTFPARVTLPDMMPIVLINRSWISFYYGCAEQEC